MWDYYWGHPYYAIGATLLAIAIVILIIVLIVNANSGGTTVHVPVATPRR